MQRRTDISSQLVNPAQRSVAVEKALSLSMSKEDLHFSPEMWEYYDLLEEQFATKYTTLLPQDPFSNKGAISQAISIKNDDLQSAIVESLFLSDATLEDILKTFDIPEKVLFYYKHLFFDITLFNNKLEVLSYLDDLPDGLHKELKRRAYSLGSHYVLYHYGNKLPETVEQKVLLKKLFLDSSYRAMEANYAPATSANAKTALEWSKIMLKAAEAVDKVLNESQSDTDLLRVSLIEKQASKKQLELPDEIEINPGDII